MKYDQFCPIAKASELLGEKWTFLIVREALMGAHRFSEFQRGLSRISPTMLTKRLNEMSENGLPVRKKIPSQKGYEYFLSEAGNALKPVIIGLGSWGMDWARGRMENSELDIELLRLYLARSIVPEKLAGNETTIQFNFSDIEKLSKWWIVVSSEEVETCIEDPGKEVDVWFNTDVRTMIEVWMGDITYRKAICDKRLNMVGPEILTRNVTNWMSNSIFAEMPEATEIE